MVCMLCCGLVVVWVVVGELDWGLVGCVVWYFIVVGVVWWVVLVLCGGGLVWWVGCVGGGFVGFGGGCCGCIGGFVDCFFCWVLVYWLLMGWCVCGCVGFMGWLGCFDCGGGVGLFWGWVGGVCVWLGGVLVLWGGLWGCLLFGCILGCWVRWGVCWFVVVVFGGLFVCFGMGMVGG